MSGTNTTTAFAYDGHLDTFTAPTAGLYETTAVGAQGGASDTGAGGMGEQVVGEFQLAQGAVLQIAVGGTSSSTTNTEGGGGGGSSAVAPNNVPLEVAGGGGEAAFSPYTAADPNGATVNVTITGANQNQSTRVGTVLADTLTATKPHQILVGGAGRDTLNANSASTTVFAGNGDDVINVNAAKATIYGGAGTNTATLNLTRRPRSAVELAISGPVIRGSSVRSLEAKSEM